MASNSEDQKEKNRQAVLKAARLKSARRGMGASLSTANALQKRDEVSQSAGKSSSSGVTGSQKIAAGAKIAQALGGDSGQSQQQGGGSAVGGALSGAATGASIGSVGGVYGAAAGAAIGAVVGGIQGAASSAAARKAHNAKVESDKEKALGRIAQEKSQQLSSALAGMGQRIGASLR